MLGGEPEWEFHAVRLLEKLAGALRIDKLRPIGILPSFYKLFSIVLALLAGDRLTELRFGQFAFRPGYQVAELVFILNQIIDKSIEFAFPLVIADMDIWKAYDSAEFSELLHAADRVHLPRILTAAWLRELSGMSSVFILSSSSQSEVVRRMRSLVQGDPIRPPSLFNLILDGPAFEFEQECRKRGLGVDMDGVAVPIILFADNCWLLARNPKELQNMTELWIKFLTQHGFHIPINEISVCTTAPDDSPCAVQLEGSVLIRKPRAVGYRVLGTIVSFDGRNTAELKDRMGKAERAFLGKQVNFR